MTERAPMERVNVYSGVFAQPAGQRLLQTLRSPASALSEADGRIVQAHLGTRHSSSQLADILSEIPVPHGRSALDDYVLMERVRAYVRDGVRQRRTRARTVARPPPAGGAPPTADGASVVSETTDVASTFSRATLVRSLKGGSPARTGGSVAAV